MSYEEHYEDRIDPTLAQLEREVSAQLVRNEAETPIWCKAMTLTDLAILSDIDQRAPEFVEMMDAARARFRTGWTTPEQIGDWLWDYAKQTGDDRWTVMSTGTNRYGEDVLVLVAGRDDESEQNFREHFGQLAKNRSRPRPPRAETLLRRFVTKHGAQPVRPIHEVVVPEDKGLWAAVVFGPCDEIDFEDIFLRQEVFQAAGKHNKRHAVAYHHGIELFVWRFKTLKDCAQFIRTARRAVSQLIEAELHTSEEYLSALGSSSTSI